MYKLIALDMDGTLLNSKKEISKANYEAIQTARENGVKVVLATGRPLQGVKKYLEELNLFSGNEYVASFNGALIQSIEDGSIISKITLNLDDYKELYELSKELGLNIHALTDTEVLTPKNNPYTQIESDINGIPIKVMPVEDVSNDTTIVKVMLIDDPELIDKIIDNIPEYFREKYTIVRSAPFFLEFLDKSVNKGAGIKIIADELNIDSKEVICVGDAGNDLHMIKYAGLGVAMDNAFDEIKNEADYVTHSNDEDGVAHVINKFILNEKSA